MKKTAKSLILGTLVLALTGCSSERTNQNQPMHDQTNPPMVQQQPTEIPGASQREELTVPTYPQKEYLPDLDPWNESPEIFGTALTVTNSKNDSEYSCCVPAYAYVKEAEDHKYVKCDSNHIILMGLSDSSYPKIETPEDVFEAYIPYMQTYLDEHHYMQTSDHVLEVKDQEEYEASGRQMIQIRGTLTFLENKNFTREWVFLGYTVPLNSGEYAYFLVSQWSSDWIQTKEIAVNMAHSFTEAS